MSWQTCKQVFVCMLHVLYKPVDFFYVWGGGIHLSTSSTQGCSSLRISAICRCSHRVASQTGLHGGQSSALFQQQSLLCGLPSSLLPPPCQRRSPAKMSFLMFAAQEAAQSNLPSFWAATSLQQSAHRDFQQANNSNSPKAQACPAPLSPAAPWHTRGCSGR